MCGSVFVCKYELRNCGSRKNWLLHFHFAFLMTIDIENPLRLIFLSFGPKDIEFNAVETFEWLLQTNERKFTLYIDISI